MDVKDVVKSVNEVLNGLMLEEMEVVDAIAKLKVLSEKLTLDIGGLEHDTVSVVIGLLNDLTGKKFKSTTKKTRSLINARLNDGFEEADLLRVVRVKVKEWHGSSMGKYLRPETLFGSKFEGYANQQDDSCPPQPEVGTMAWDKWFYITLSAEQRAEKVLSKEVTYGLEAYMKDEKDMEVLKRIVGNYGNNSILKKLNNKGETCYQQ